MIFLLPKVVDAEPRLFGLSRTFQRSSFSRRSVRHRQKETEGMSDKRQNRPILSADKIARQKSVVCHAKIARFCWPTKSPDFISQDRACSIFENFVGRLFMLQWWLLTTEYEYLFKSFIVFVIYFRSLDAEKVMQVLFCDLHSAVVLADIVRSSRRKYRPCVMFHRFCRPILSVN